MDQDDSVLFPTIISGFFGNIGSECSQMGLLYWDIDNVHAGWGILGRKPWTT
jgi:hypothetical protein